MLGTHRERQGMDMVTIAPSPLCGTVKIPPSKSFAHRAIISAFLSNGSCTVSNIELSKDIEATLSCVKALGGNAEFDKKTLTVSFKKADKSCAEPPVLDCGESGSTLRFFIPIALALVGGASFKGHGKLMERPLEPYFEIFQKKGIKYHKTKNVLTLSGKLTSGEFSLDGSVSSQFLTGLLFALPILDGDSIIKIDGNLSSKGYVDITLDVLKNFGIEIENLEYKTFLVKGNQKYTATNYTVEGDFSQAAFFLVAGALGCDVCCQGLRRDSLQGDKKITEILEKAGAKVTWLDDNTLKASQSPLMHSITVDADEIPDLVPIISVLLSFCKGKSRIENAARLRLKESDRLAAMASELSKMGADITEGADFLEISGKQTLRGCDLSSWNDHRIAMALSVAACRAEGGISIKGAKKAITKSYPTFFDDYVKLGGNLK